MVGHTTKQMKHVRSYDIQIWWLSVENVALGLRPRVTSYLHVALTTVHHLYNDEFILFTDDVLRCCVRACSDSQNVRRMTTAIHLNQVLRQHSTDAKLVIVNMPKPPKDEDGEKTCILSVSATRPTT